MSKIKISANIELDTYNKLREIAKKDFSGNTSQALDWLIRSMDEEKFYEFVAKKAASELYHFKSTLDAIREKKQVIVTRKEALQTWQHSFVEND